MKSSRYYLTIVFSLAIGLSATAFGANGPSCEYVFAPAQAQTQSQSTTAERSYDLARQGVKYELNDGSQIILAGTSGSFKGEQAQLAENYLNFATQIYESRLEKYSEKPGSLQAIDTEINDRSVYLVNKKTVGKGEYEIIGGVRIAFAMNAGEKLPFQFDFPDFNRENPHVPAAEIGRLTSVVGSARTMELLSTAAYVIDLYAEVQYYYVHTSSKHARLYNMMGFRPSKTVEFDKLNVIMIFTREDLSRFIEAAKAAKS